MPTMNRTRENHSQAMKIKKSFKIALLGAPHVRAATAFALLLKGLADEIVLVDTTTDQRKSEAEAEALDLTHAALFACHHPRVYAGNLEDCRDAAIVVIIAWNASSYGENGQTLLEGNIEILKNVAPEIGAVAPKALVIVAGHPNEVLTYAAARLSGISNHRVMGCGTVLDTTIFRHELAELYGVDPQDVHAAIVGQHARFEVPVWSAVHINGLPLESYRQKTGREYEDDGVVGCFLKARDAGFEVVKRRGNAGYSMAMGIVAIVEALAREESTLLTVAVAGRHLGIEGTALSVPSQLSRAGVKQVSSWSDDWYEEEEMRHCAEEVKAQIDSLGALTGKRV